jgi:hypothetical protein
MTEPLVLYHKGCVDGWTAAWVMDRFLRWTQPGCQPELRAVRYGDEAPPDQEVLGRAVYVVDFSFPRPDLVRLSSSASSFVILDHHKTAEVALEGIPGAVFDLDRSGAMLAWDYWAEVREGWPASRLLEGMGLLVDYVQDRDLWRWELEDGRAVSAYLRTLPMVDTIWDEAARRMRDDLPRVVHAGEAVRRRENILVEIMASRAHPVCLAGVELQACNAGILQSDLAEHLNKTHTACGIWHRTRSGEAKWSLRSQVIDVSAIACQFEGGGGHRNAAGFRVPWARHLELLG